MAKRMATDQISFYDETLKKQIEGSYVSDGKEIHVRSAYGIKSAPYGHLGTFVDQGITGYVGAKAIKRVGA